MLFIHLKDLAAEAFEATAQLDHHQTIALIALEEEALLAQAPECDPAYSEERAQQEDYSEARAQADMLPPDLRM